MNMGSGNFNIQGRAAAETGGGDPSMKPSSNDKRVVMLAGIAIAVAAVVIVIVSMV